MPQGTVHDNYIVKMYFTTLKRDSHLLYNKNLIYSQFLQILVIINFK